MSLLDAVKNSQRSRPSVSWNDVDADIIGTLVQVACGEGYSILFSQSRLSSAISITVYSDSGKDKVWFNSVNELISFLESLS